MPPLKGQEWVTAQALLVERGRERPAVCPGAEQTLGPLSWGSRGGLGPDGEQPASSSHTPLSSSRAFMRTEETSLQGLVKCSLTPARHQEL